MSQRELADAMTESLGWYPLPEDERGLYFVRGCNSHGDIRDWTRRAGYVLTFVGERVLSDAESRYAGGEIRDYITIGQTPETPP